MPEKAKILIVDDIEANREVLKNLVISLGHEPILAVDGEDALEQIQKNRPDLILLDILMPKLTGYGVLKQLKKRTAFRFLPIIMISAVDEIETVIQCIESGADDYLTKPFNQTLLRARITSCLDKKMWRDSERHFMETTLRGSVKMMMGIFSMANPKAFNLGDRVRKLLRHMARELGLQSTYIFELGALFSQIGSVTIPADIMQKYLSNGMLSPEEMKMVSSYPQSGSKLLEKIPRFKSVAEMVRNQQVPFDRFRKVESVLDLKEGEVGAQMLKTAIDFQRFLNQGNSVEKTLETVSADTRNYNPEIVMALKSYFGEEKTTPVDLVSAEDLKPGMVLGKDVYTIHNVLFAGAGEVLDDFWIERIQNFHANGQIKNEIPVLKEAGQPQDLLEPE